MKELIQQGIEASQSYTDYRQMLTDLLAEGKTTGPNQSDFYLKIAKLNQSRMNRLDKKTKLTEELAAKAKGLKNAYLFLTLTEGWCGDAAQTVPVLNKLAEASEQIDLRLILRDEHLPLMDLFLTDNGRSIPKTIVLDPDSLEVLADWGPRPAEAQKMAMAYKYKPEPKEPYEEHHMELHGWYAKDKTLSTQSEILDLLEDLENRLGIMA
ncbi:MAG: thioredoxin family protein [Bacteroidota bacterium]